MIKVTSDNTLVFRNTGTDSEGNERVMFNYSISSKVGENSYKYMSKQIKFKKGEEPKETCNIKINDAFLSFYSKGEEKIDYLMVLDYEIIKEDNDEFNDIVLTDDDLPF